MNRFLAVAATLFFSYSLNAAPPKVFKIDLSNLTDISRVAVIPERIIKVDPQSNIFVVQQMVLTNNKIYVSSRLDKALYILDHSGKSIKKIDSRALEPKQTFSLDWFDVSPSGEVIFILDVFEDRLVSFHNLGIFLNSIKLKNRYYSLACITGSHIAFSRGNGNRKSPDFSLDIMDINGKLQTSMIPIEVYKKGVNIGMPNLFTRINDKLFYMPPLDSKVYQIINGSAEPIYEFDFGKYWPPAEFIKKHRDKSTYELLKKIGEAGYVLYLNYYETTDQIYLRFNHGKSPRSVIIDKASGKTYVFDNSNGDIPDIINVYKDSFVNVHYNEYPKRPLIRFVKFKLQ